MSEVDLQKFQSVVDASDPSATFRLTADRKGVESGLGTVKWVKNLQPSENQEVAKLFVDALKQSYGDQITETVVGSTSLSDELVEGKPLHARKVTLALNGAAKTKELFIDSNQKVSSTYSKPVAAGSDPSMLQIRYDEVEKRLFSREGLLDTAQVEDFGMQLQAHTYQHAETPLFVGEGVLDTTQVEDLSTQLQAHCDLEGIGREVEQAIVRASKGDTVFVTSEAAAKIADRIIAGHLQKAYRAILNDKVSLTNKDSYSCKTFKKITSQRGLDINLEHLEKSLFQALNKELEEGASDAIHRKAMDGEELILSEYQEQKLYKPIRKFAEERCTAYEEIDKLRIAEPIKSLLLERAMYDDVPANLAQDFAQAYLQLGDSVAVLGQPGASSGDVQQALTRINDTLLRAVQGPKKELVLDTRDRVMQAFWRLMLVNTSDDQLQGLADQLQGAPLHPFREGAAYVQIIFAASEIGMRDEETYAPGVKKAAEYALLLSSLQQVLDDRRGVISEFEPATSTEELSDSTVVMLRNVGVTLPAPNRLGKTGRTGLSAAAFAEVQRDLDGALESTEPVDDGLTASFLSDLGSATYSLEGEDLGKDPATIISRLRLYCTNEAGQLNEAMLLGISRYAHQGNFARVIEMFEDEHLSPFQAAPAMRLTGSTYSIAKNDQGGITITSTSAGPVDGVTDQSEERLSLDPAASRIRMEQVLTLDANTFKPTLQSVDIEYAFSAPRGGE